MTLIVSVCVFTGFMIYVPVQFETGPGRGVFVLSPEQLTHMVHLFLQQWDTEPLTPHLLPSRQSWSHTSQPPSW